MSFTNGSVLQEGQSASLRRHQSQCSVCCHPECQEIEEAWLDWANTAQLAEKHRLSRYAVSRHMDALGLDRVRQTNRKRLFEKVLERVEITTFKGSDLVKVLKEYAALCGGDESEQAASLPAQGMLDSVSGREAEEPAEVGAPLAEPAPQGTPEVKSVPTAEGNEQGEPAVTPPASPEAEILEAAVSNTAQ